MIRETATDIWTRQGLSAEEQQRNLDLLSGYDPGAYSSNLTGYNAMNLQEITVSRRHRAIRTRVGPRGNYKAGMTMLADGCLLPAVCREVTGGLRIYLYVSVDEGLSWQEQPERDDLWGKEPSLTSLPDGTLLMTAQPYSLPVADATQTVVYRSKDRGASWETIVLEGHDYPRNLLVEQDGSVMYARAKERAGIETIMQKAGKPYHPSPHLEIMRSRDGGRTWHAEEGRVDWRDPFAGGEISLARLDDGRLLASLRGTPPGTTGEGEQVTWLSESSDDGGTWSRPRIVGHVGCVHVHLLKLRSGRLLATYSNYRLPFGTCAVLSDDEGQTWSFDQSILLSLSNGIWVGWPVSLELLDGSILTSYASTAYSGQTPRVVCETVRWTIPG